MKQLFLILYIDNNCDEKSFPIWAESPEKAVETLKCFYPVQEIIAILE